MKFEITERGSDAFYREICNVVFQAKHYKKKPAMKYVDTFKRTKILMILLIVMEVLQIVMGVAWGFDPVSIALTAIVAFLIVVYIKLYGNMTGYYRSISTDSRTSVFKIDDYGIELDRIGSHAVRIAWENIAFVRVFKESMIFFSKDEPMAVIALDRPHMGPVVEYLKEHDFEVMS